MPKFCVITLVVIFSAALFAQVNANDSALDAQNAQEAPASPEGLDPALLIGAQPPDVIAGWGAPQEVHVLRARQKEHDAVIFYREGVSFFFIANRMWQLRFDQRWSGTWRGLSIGSSADLAAGLFGRPWYDEDGEQIFSIEGHEYPLQLRIFLQDGLVDDIYVYRSSF